MYEDYNKPDFTIHGPDKSPDITIIGGVHGDEPSGVKVVEKLRDQNPSFNKTVQLVIANPLAVREEKRYIEKDLNRVYPGDKEGVLEEQIATELVDLMKDTVVLSLHSTQSVTYPFTIFNICNKRLRNIVSSLDIEYCVDPTNLADGDLSDISDIIELETGPQNSMQSIKQAQRLTEQFLITVGAKNGELHSNTNDNTYFQMVETIDKPDDISNSQCDNMYNLRANNFQIIKEGDAYIEYLGNKVRATEDFYPILMSKCGYKDIFGYKGQQVQISEICDESN